MREIKYKVFDVITLTMYNHVNQINFGLECVLAQPDENSTVDEEVELDFERYMLLQFTGLFDKNGKEIYEGDILRSEEEHALGDNRNYHVVTWIRERAAFYMIDVDVYKVYINEKNTLENDPDYDWLFEQANLYDFSIDVGLDLVGNIHENPELI